MTEVPNDRIKQSDATTRPTQGQPPILAYRTAGSSAPASSRFGQSLLAALVFVLAAFIFDIVWNGILIYGVGHSWPASVRRFQFGENMTVGGIINGYGCLGFLAAFSAFGFGRRGPALKVAGLLGSLYAFVPSLLDLFMQWKKEPLWLLWGWILVMPWVLGAAAPFLRRRRSGD